MGKPAARITDMHTCPIPTHVGGPIITGNVTVLIGGMPAATVGDVCTCVGPPDVIVQGSSSVFIGGRPAARMGDSTAHGGKIVMGCFSVLIGDAGAGSGVDAFQSGNEGSPTQAGEDPLLRAAAALKGGPPPVVIPKECAYLEKGSTVEASRKKFNRIRGKARISKPKAIRHQFPGDTAEQDALEYEVEVNGRRKKVIMPKNPPRGATETPTIKQIANALGTVPGTQLDNFPQVEVSPNPNPDDAYWATEYNDPGFTSGASGGKTGVTFYPAADWDQEGVDSTMIHESGHAYSEGLWADAAKRTAWEDAMKADGRSPSTYADNSTGEDFSESLVMYSLSKGTPCEATAKQLFPNRYKILDDLLVPKHTFLDAGKP